MIAVLLVSIAGFVATETSRVLKVLRSGLDELTSIAVCFFYLRTTNTLPFHHVGSTTVQPLPPLFPLQEVVKVALDKAVARTQKNLIFKVVSTCESEAALVRRGTELDNDDLDELTVADLRDSLGQFLKVIAEFDEEQMSTPKVLRSGLDELTSIDRQQRALPSPPTGKRYEYRLFAALISSLEAEGLSFPKLDVEQSGRRMLTALSNTLQYLLPFADSTPSPLRLDGRVHLIMPERFSTQRLNHEQLSHEHHGGKLTEARLSPHKLHEKGATLAGYLDCAAWSRQTAAWKPPSCQTSLCLLNAWRSLQPQWARMQHP